MVGIDLVLEKIKEFSNIQVEEVHDSQPQILTETTNLTNSSKRYYSLSSTLGKNVGVSTRSMHKGAKKKKWKRWNPKGSTILARKIGRQKKIGKLGKEIKFS